MKIQTPPPLPSRSLLNKLKPVMLVADTSDHHVSLINTSEASNSEISNFNSSSLLFNDVAFVYMQLK